MSVNFDFIAQLPGLVIAKDYESNYLSISQDFAKLLGWKSAEECPGKTDYDIPCKAAEFASEFIQMDKQVIDSGKKLIALDVQQYECGWKLILVERNPLMGADGKITGLFNQAIDISETNLFRAYITLNEFDNKLLNIKNKPVSYILNNAHSPLSLTPKQQTCLFLLIRGKTTKQIANILNLSIRTVECHIEAIKTRLNCYSKSQLIEKAFDSGFLYYVPEHLINKNLENIIHG